MYQFSQEQLLFMQQMTTMITAQVANQVAQQVAGAMAGAQQQGGTGAAQNPNQNVDPTKRGVADPGMFDGSISKFEEWWSKMKAFVIVSNSTSPRARNQKSGQDAWVVVAATPSPVHLMIFQRVKMRNLLPNMQFLTYGLENLNLSSSGIYLQPVKVPDHQPLSLWRWSQISSSPVYALYRWVLQLSGYFDPLVLWRIHQTVSMYKDFGGVSGGMWATPHFSSPSIENWRSWNENESWGAWESVRRFFKR
ncbi:hypothetical protein EDD15DRAFT_2193502 [Pisolithus albus]|nr:hypothetical protein EDD15DRAFT_2193502 [Pisolithus albus]